MAEPFRQLTAVAAPYDPVNVDTDQLLPARFLKFPRTEGYGDYLFHDLRYGKDGTLNASFVLNRPAYRGAGILVGNHNFGCGSSREGAVYALHDHGIRSVIAPSFSDIFYNNCLRNGMVPARLTGRQCAQLRALLEAQPGTPLTVDLERQQVLAPDGQAYEFSVDSFSRDLLLAGLDEVGLTLGLLDEVDAFERAYVAGAPWVLPPPLSEDPACKK